MCALAESRTSLQKTKSGLVIPEKAQEKAKEATVVAAGQGGHNHEGEVLPMAVKVGDTVLVPEYGGTKLVFEEKVRLPGVTACLETVHFSVW